MTEWLDRDGPLKETVLSSRIRLARNFTEVPFPTAMSREMAVGLVAQIRECLPAAGERFRLLNGEDLTQQERQLLLEKHLISQEFLRGRLPGLLLLDGPERVSIMVNEEDHLRIQCLLPGLQLQEAYTEVQGMDDFFDDRMTYAFDERLGYLTACPTNVGTGLRASVMMHLPALTLSGAMDRVLKAARQIGLAVRGLYGEGSDAAGSMYQISNQQTLGRTEKELIDTLADVARQVATEERMARELLVRSSSLELEDRIWRSYGTLRHARRLTAREALERFSDLRLGIATGLFTALGQHCVDELLFRIQPAFLQEAAGRVLGPEEQDAYRATWVRSRLQAPDDGSMA